MSELSRFILWSVAFLLTFRTAAEQSPVGAFATPTTTTTGDLQPGLRTEPKGEAASVEGLIRLDVTVSDLTGKSVAGLRSSDFKLLDNGEPERIVAFRAADSKSAASEDSLSVILFVDTLELSLQQAEIERQQVAQFLRSQQLKQPVTIYSLENSGFFLTANASTDGSALASAVTTSQKERAYFLAPKVHSPLKPVVELPFDDVPALTGLRALWTICTEQVKHPGRKMLFWIGPQGTLGTGAFDPNGDFLWKDVAQGIKAHDLSSGKTGEEEKREIFKKICWFSMLMRQARVTLDCFSSNDGREAEIWRRLAGAIPSVPQANWMHLFKNVLALQSGGQVLSPSHGLIESLNDSLENARIYYSLTFDPPPAGHADDYHLIRVRLSRPVLTAMTSTGYFDQPFYDDPPAQGNRQINVVDLEGMLHTGRKISALSPSLVLTERLGEARLQSLLAQDHDQKERDSLELIAADSTFLDPPAEDRINDPAPKPGEQQRILQAAIAYLDRAIPGLPNVFATRTVAFYGETSPSFGSAARNLSQPLHLERRWQQPILYSHGEEVEGTSSQEVTQPAQTYGTFGPVLSLVRLILASPGNLTWGWWEQDTNGRHAVFRFQLAGTPTVVLRGCCYPNSGENSLIRSSSDSHGEITIDPRTGALLRVATESDLPGLISSKRSDVMVSYGPVQVGTEIRIVPLKSVSIRRDRTIVPVFQWNVNFLTWGPYRTQLSIYTFNDYHLSSGKAKLLPGFKPIPD